MEPSTEYKFELHVKGNVKMQTTMDSFATNARYAMFYNGLNAIKPELKEYVLEELDVKLTDYFDPGTYQLIEYINKLARVYSRQHVCINHIGEIKGLLNIREIRTKWEELKKELMQVNPISAFEIISHKDRELNSPQQLIDNLANGHFMFLFLYGWHNNIEELIGRKEKLQQDRMGIGVSLPINQSFTSVRTDYGYQVSAEGQLKENGKINRQLIIETTGETSLTLKHHTRATFNYKHSGELLAAEMTIFEQLNSEFKTDLYLKLNAL